jgi:hypothetical protein
MQPQLKQKQLQRRLPQPWHKKSGLLMLRGWLLQCSCRSFSHRTSCSALTVQSATLLQWH